MTAKRCKNCGKLLQQSKIEGFCSVECKRDYLELMDYELNRVSEEFKEVMKKYAY